MQSSTRIVSILLSHDVLAQNAVLRNLSYGEKGGYIIQHALRWMFPESPELLRNAHPLTFQLFIEHLLVPHVATVLIAEDNDLGLEEAHRLMLRSGEFGLHRFPVEDDDEELEDIIQSMSRDMQNKP